MTSHSESSAGRPAPAAGFRVAAMRVGEFAVLALLLVVDAELGSRSTAGASGSALIATALGTAAVAVAIAVVALTRRSVPPVVTVAVAFGVSLAASVVSIWIGSPALSLTEAVALAVVTVVGVSRTPVRTAVVSGSAALVVAVVAVVARVGWDVTLFLAAVLVWCAAIGVGVAVRSALGRRESAVEEARRAERMELARELHDVVAHQVTGIVVQAQAALAVTRTDPERAAEGFAAIEAAGTEALAGMRRMVGAIRDDAERAAPLTVPYALDDIPPLVDRFDDAAGRTALRWQVSDRPLPPGVAESAYRVVREALTNVRRHARDATTRVVVRDADSVLVVDVHNDGVDPAAVPRAGVGYGLTGMTERVEALGGTLSAGPDEPGTWRVRAALPLDATRDGS